MKADLSRYETMTLPAIQYNISPVPIGQRPRFLPKGIKWQAKNGSNDAERLAVVHSFLMSSAISVAGAELFVIKIILHH